MPTQQEINEQLARNAELARESQRLMDANGYEREAYPDTNEAKRELQRVTRGDGVKSIEAIARRLAHTAHIVPKGGY